MAMQAVLYAFLTTLLPPDADVEGVLQEVNIAVWRALQDGNIHKFNAFVYGVARNKAKDCLRKLGRNRLVLCEGDVLEKLVNIWAERPEMQSGGKRQHVLRKCLTKLTDQDKTRLGHYYADRVTIREMAAREKRSEASLQQHFHRLRLKLKKCIELNLNTEGEIA